MLALAIGGVALVSFGSFRLLNRRIRPAVDSSSDELSRSAPSSVESPRSPPSVAPGITSSPVAPRPTTTAEPQTEQPTAHADALGRDGGGPSPASRLAANSAFAGSSRNAVVETTDAGGHHAAVRGDVTTTMPPKTDSAVATRAAGTLTGSTFVQGPVAAPIAGTKALPPPAPSPPTPPAQRVPEMPAPPANDDSDRQFPPAPAPSPTNARVMMVAEPAQVRIGSSLVLHVLIEGASGAASVPFHVIFNPAVLRFEGGEEGSFLSGGGQTAFFASPTSTGNRVVVGLSRIGGDQGVSGSGELCRLRFTVIGAGEAGLAFDRAKVRGVSNAILAASFISQRVLVKG